MVRVKESPHEYGKLHALSDTGRSKSMRRVFPFFCKHEYVFETDKKMMVYPPMYIGVCKKCGAQITIDQSTYKRNYEQK